jgi:FkbM family methyltransferase
LKYDFIEIGTSDFDTCIQKCDQLAYGLVVEPLSFYLENLPNKPNCKKINAAVSDWTGNININFIHPEIIKSRNFPDWIRGCNTIGNNIHPTVGAFLRDNNISFDIVQSEKIKVITLQQLFLENDVTECDLLKVDTEGHDITILLHYFSSDCILPKKIIFENNVLTDPADFMILKEKLYSFSYKFHDDRSENVEFNL